MPEEVQRASGGIRWTLFEGGCQSELKIRIEYVGVYAAGQYSLVARNTDRHPSIPSPTQPIPTPARLRFHFQH